MSQPVAWKLALWLVNEKEVLLSSAFVEDFFYLVRHDTQAEELLIEEVRKYEHLYNPSCPGYHGRIMVNNAWKEISKNLERPEFRCKTTERIAFPDR